MGKRFSTFQSFNGVTKKAAFDGAYRVLAQDGYYIESADESKGIISAFQNVNLSDKKAPLNVIVEKQGEGSSIRLVFVAAAGIYTPEDGAQREFCRIIERSVQ